MWWDTFGILDYHPVYIRRYLVGSRGRNVCDSGWWGDAIGICANFAQRASAISDWPRRRRLLLILSFDLHGGLVMHQSVVTSRNKLNMKIVLCAPI